MSYTANLNETQNDNLDVRIVEIANRFGYRNNDTCVWAFDNHHLFMMMRALLDSEDARIIKAASRAPGCMSCAAFDSGMSTVVFAAGCEGCKERMLEANGLATKEKSMTKEMIPVSRELLHRFTKWRLCMSYNDSYFSEPAGELKRTALEIDHVVNTHDRLVAENEESTDRDIKALVNRFLAWTLPQTVCADGCATNSLYAFPRSGTNLLNAEEAEQMIRYVLAAYDPVPVMMPKETRVANERAEFEAWAKDQGMGKTIRGFDRNGHTYHDDQLDAGWRVWQARAEKDAEEEWQTGVPPTKHNDYDQYIVAVRRAHAPEEVFVFASHYANHYSNDDLQDQDGKEYVADGWYDVGTDMSGEYNDLFSPMLNPGDEVLGWQQLPKYRP